MPVLVPSTAINDRIVVDLETDQGVPKTSAKKARKFACLSTLSKDVGQDDVDEVRSDPNAQDPTPGVTDVAGDLTFAPNLTLAPFFLRWFCNDYSAGTGSADPWLYAGKLKGGKLATIMVEQGFTDLSTVNYEKFIGLGAKTFSGDWGASGLLKWKFGCVGMDKTAVSTTPYDTTIIDWETGAKLHHAQIAAAGMKIGGAAVDYVLTGSWNMERTIVTEDRPVGLGGLLASLPIGKVMCSGSVNFRFKDTAVLTLLQSGAASSLELKWLVSASPAHYILFRWNRVFWKYTSPKKSKDGMLELNTTWKASYDPTDTSSFAWEVSNDQDIVGTPYA